MAEIEELRVGIDGMSHEAVERARIKPKFLQYLRDLVELKGKAEVEVAVVDANLRTTQDNMVDMTTHRDQITELHQHFEWGDIEPMDYVDVVDLLRRVFSPDADDVPDERLDSGDESEVGEGLGEPQEPEEVGKKGKGKGKAKVASKKARKEHEERDGPSAGGAYETLLNSSFY
jgi:hypothetical protein